MMHYIQHDNVVTCRGEAAAVRGTYDVSEVTCEDCLTGVRMQARVRSSVARAAGS